KLRAQLGENASYQHGGGRTVGISRLRTQSLPLLRSPLEMTGLQYRSQVSRCFLRLKDVGCPTLHEPFSLLDVLWFTLSRSSGVGKSEESEGLCIVSQPLLLQRVGHPRLSLGKEIWTVGHPSSWHRRSWSIEGLQRCDYSINKLGGSRSWRNHLRHRSRH